MEEGLEAVDWLLVTTTWPSRGTSLLRLTQLSPSQRRSLEMPSQTEGGGASLSP